MNAEQPWRYLYIHPTLGTYHHYRTTGNGIWVSGWVESHGKESQEQSLLFIRFSDPADWKQELLPRFSNQ